MLILTGGVELAQEIANLNTGSGHHVGFPNDPTLCNIGVVVFDVNSGILSKRLTSTVYGRR